LSSTDQLTVANDNLMMGK